MQLPELTIGIEEEYQIIDPESRELKSYIQEFLQQGQAIPPRSDQIGIPAVSGGSGQPDLPQCE